MTAKEKEAAVPLLVGKAAGGQEVVGVMDERVVGVIAMVELNIGEARQSLRCRQRQCQRRD